MDSIVKFLNSDQQKPKNKSVRPSREEAEAAVRTLIAYTGDDPDREGLRETPSRFVRAYDEWFMGYNDEPQNHLNRVFEEESGYREFVLLRDIEFTSHCEHHIAPFFGLAHIAYYPANGVLGLSKLARLVDVFALRLQTQEKLTTQISLALDEYLKPLGTAVMLEAVHTCISIRGVKKHGSRTVTTHFSGDFETDQKKQKRFLKMIGQSRDLSV